MSLSMLSLDVCSAIVRSRRHTFAGIDGCLDNLDDFRLTPDPITCDITVHIVHVRSGLAASPDSVVLHKRWFGVLQLHHGLQLISTSLCLADVLHELCVIVSNWSAEEEIRFCQNRSKRESTSEPSCLSRYVQYCCSEESMHRKQCTLTALLGCFLGFLLCPSADDVLGSTHSCRATVVDTSDA